MADASRPALPPATLHRVRRLLAAAAFASLGAVLVVAGLAQASGRPAVAAGVVVGFLTGGAIAGSWALGAAWGFGAEIHLFRRLTLGLWPLRVAILLLGFAIGDAVLHADRGALLTSLLLTWTGGQVLHGWVAMTLADAAKAARAAESVPTAPTADPAPPNPGLVPRAEPPRDES